MFDTTPKGYVRIACDNAIAESIGHRHHIDCLLLNGERDEANWHNPYVLKCVRKYITTDHGDIAVECRLRHPERRVDSNSMYRETPLYPRKKPSKRGRL